MASWQVSGERCPARCIERVWKPARQPVTHPHEHKSLVGDPGQETGATSRRSLAAGEQEHEDEEGEGDEGEGGVEG